MVAILRVIVASLALLAPYATAYEAAEYDAEAFESTAPTLCTLLESIRPGEKREVTISGIYWVSFESQFLYDPRTPLCSLDVQPATWVVLSKSVTEDSRFREFTAPRAYVTFKGVLHGPGIVEEDDLSIPIVGSFANRIAFDRYGHLNAFRTQLVVDEIVHASAVSDDVPLHSLYGRPKVVSAPTVREAPLPQYPENARRAGIQGIVELRVVVENGEVKMLERVSGDRILFEASRQNVAGWTFESTYTGTFVTKFEYQLDLRALGSNPNTRHEIALPYSVRLFGRLDGW